MTKRLYDEDAYIKEFEAEVISVSEDNENLIIELDRTAFFPESGGQTSDIGFIEDFPVRDVQIEDDTIFHYIKKEDGVSKDSFKGKIKARIDWEHRFSNMQQHSGEHIFSGLVNREYGFNNVGFHLSDNIATMDFDGFLSEENVRDLELKVNKVIVQNVTIRAYYPDSETLKTLSYRSKKELSGPVRIVEVGDIDRCACCAPHVLKTGEIGLFKITGYEKYKKGVRLTYLCGFRALEYFNLSLDTLKDIEREISAKAGSEYESVKRLNEENKDLKYRVTGLIQSKLSQDINLLKEPVWIGDRSEASELKFVINLMHASFPGTVFAFAGNEEEGYRYLIESDTEDLTELSKLLRERYNAKGGGRKDSIQGSAPLSIKDIDAIVQLK